MARAVEGRGLVEEGAGAGDDPLAPGLVVASPALGAPVLGMASVP
jgi:hypothetical protein